MNDRPRGRRSVPPAKPLPDVALDIRAQSRRWRELSDLKGLRALVSEAVHAGLAFSTCRPLAGAELSVLLTDDARIRRVNREWRGFDKATNVLSFPAVPPDRIAASPVLGDIVLAFETVAREAGDEGKALPDHLRHLVIHGLLHLLGEDHETEAEARRMEALEIAALASLGIADPYANADLVTAAAPSLAEP